MQPHFPGYPYFILGGMLLHPFLGDPLQSLSIFNSILTLSSIIPIYLLFKRKYSSVTTLLFVALIHSLSYIWVLSTEVMSEAAAISVLCWYVWSLYQSYKKPGSIWGLLPLLLFSILMGIRLSYLPFGLGLLLIWWYERKRFKTKQYYILFILKQLLIAISFQLIWVIALVISTGGISLFTELAFGFVTGHFTEWGGAVTADSMPIWKRLYTLLVYNLLWKTLLAESWIIACLYGGLILLSVFHITKTKKVDTFNLWVLLVCVFYFVWVLFAQNIDKPRHIAPVIVFLVYLILWSFGGRMRILFLTFCFALIMVQSWIGITLVKEKATNPPAVYQLSNYLTKIDEPFVIYTWEESRVMEYLKVNYSYNKIYTYEQFQNRLAYNKDKRVFLTDHVLRGFEIQGYNIRDHVRKVSEFHSSDLFDPVYNNLYLYEWISD
ncbi:glycosyltransferase family 39 protein [Pontibacillus sp. HMF3514]|uniref:glycosyltransferase family 39 protein n=1 Tax=Pontibacillus sp. HMF3514 TaxID=2692425 RepID=UPI0021021011|nr:glycosyltransferase family 39 protein [Pontibacillus sp. HMF3514]